MIKPIFIVILTLAGFGFGYSVCYFHIYPISIENKINLLDLFTLLFTVLIAFYIPTAIGKSITNKRYEREVLIKKIEEIQKVFMQIDQLFFSCYNSNIVSQDDASSIVKDFKDISINLDTLIQLSNRVCPNKLHSKIKGITTLRGQYKKIITGGNFQTPGFVYSNSDKIKAEKAISIIDAELSHLIFDVNAY